MSGYMGKRTLSRGNRSNVLSVDGMGCMRLVVGWPDILGHYRPL